MAQYLQENSVASGLQLPDNNPANSANPPDYLQKFLDPM
jgi:hypothetical protein